MHKDYIKRILIAWIKAHDGRQPMLLIIDNDLYEALIHEINKASPIGNPQVTSISYLAIDDVIVKVVVNDKMDVQII
jgi:hypothetical protein